MTEPSMTSPHADLRFGPYLDVAVRSSVGAGPVQRAENQDNYVLIDFDGNAAFLRDQQPQGRRIPGWTEGHGRLAVLDGMGGHGHGREAAEAVAEALLAVPPCASVTELSQQLDALHAALQHRFAALGETGPRPGTTLTMLELRPGQAPLLLHVGDSRLYEITHQRVAPLSVDHVPATAMAMAGQLSEPAWWRHVHGEHWPQIAQAVILGNTFADPMRLSDPLFELTPSNLPPWLRHLPDRRPVELRAGALYLLATDGFWSCADPHEFVGRWPGLLSGCASAAAMLERLFGEMDSNPPRGLQPDNLTALLLRPLPHNADETALPAAAGA